VAAAAAGQVALSVLLSVTISQPSTPAAAACSSAVVSAAQSSILALAQSSDASAFVISAGCSSASGRRELASGGGGAPRKLVSSITITTVVAIANAPLANAVKTAVVASTSIGSAVVSALSASTGHQLSDFSASQASIYSLTCANAALAFPDCVAAAANPPALTEPQQLGLGLGIGLALAAIFALFSAAACAMRGSPRAANNILVVGPAAVAAAAVPAGKPVR